MYASITAQGTESGFFRSPDGGETLDEAEQLEHERSAVLRRVSLDPFRFDRVCALAVTNVCTSDGGKTFTPMSWSVHVDNHHIGFDPTNSLHLWSGNDGGLLLNRLESSDKWRHFQISATQFYAITLDNTLPFYNIYGGTQDNGSDRHAVALRTPEWNSRE